MWPSTRAVLRLTCTCPPTSSRSPRSCSSRKPAPEKIPLPAESFLFWDMKKRLMSLLAGLACWGANAQDIQIIPQPTVVQPGQGQFALHNKTVIVAQGDALPAAQFLQGYLQDQYGLSLGIANQAKEGANIQLNTNKLPARVAGAYDLTVAPKGIVVAGDGGAGAFYAVQTIIQLLPLEKKNVLLLPAVAVQDQARFAYRGLHLDVSRHFYPVAYIKKYI
ncbi:MAG: hypothetical protein EAZ62_10145 [Sphingobacteriia bacterium]|nr:MAG: hypothetical protein EAZ62_10145 [Sphingobacteriia bacterium]